MVNEIIIYSKVICPFCDKAKAFFDHKGLQYTEINIENSDTLREEMLKKANGQKTVPQIFINGTHIGGYDNLMESNTSGQLEKILSSNN